MSEDQRLRPEDLNGPEYDTAWRDSETGFAPIPAGVYTCKVTDIVPVQGNFGPQVRINLTILDEAFRGRKLTSFSSLDPDPKRMKWTKIALNIISPEFVKRSSLKAALFDSELIEGVIGTIVRVKCETNKKGDGVYTNLKEFVSRPDSSYVAPAVHTEPAVDDEVPFS
jgi:hypothetical protein